MMSRRRCVPASGAKVMEGAAVEPPMMAAMFSSKRSTRWLGSCRLMRSSLRRLRSSMPTAGSAR